MQARIARGQDAAALARIAAIPGRDHAARALNDRDQRDDVEILKSSFDHEVDLTEREHQILERVAAGDSNKEIAAQLQLREKTVKHHMTNILQKLHVRNRVEAALLAKRNGNDRSSR